MLHKEPAAASSITPLPPSPIIPPWIQNQFDQIENLQLLILKQQGDLKVALDTINTESIVLLKKVKDLQALTNNEITPALEKAILATASSAKTIDQKVPDTKPPPSTTPPGSTTPPPTNSKR